MLKSTFIVANVVLSFLDVFVALEISRDRIGNSYVRIHVPYYKRGSHGN